MLKNSGVKHICHQVVVHVKDDFSMLHYLIKKKTKDSLSIMIIFSRLGKLKKMGKLKNHTCRLLPGFPLKQQTNRFDFPKLSNTNTGKNIQLSCN